MKRAWAATVIVVLAAIGAGVGAWTLVRGQHTPQPQISVYSDRHTVRVDPFLYCNVVNLNDCLDGGVQGELGVSARYPVQLSVPTRISDAPWRLLQVYADEPDTIINTYRPGAQSAVTIPTVDPQRGRLVGLVVQLLTLVEDETGELRDLPHAEWSIKLNWT